jgi:homoserine kinase type II
VKISKKKKGGGKKQKYYIAVFSYLRGEDKYSWDTPLCTDKELADAARVLALYHNTVFGWQVKEKWKKPVFADYIPSIIEKWSCYSQEAEHSVFDLYFLDQFDDLLRFLKGLMKSPGQKKYNVMPHIAIHGDYHPGNLKFHNEKVIGVFDFDWAKIDTRCFDVSLAVNYFCSSWKETKDGGILLDRVEAFLDAYQEAAKAKDGLGALNGLELDYFPEMMMMSNLFVINWTVKSFYQTKPDPEEYQTYLRHNISLMEWLEHYRERLAKCILKYRC